MCVCHVGVNTVDVVKVDKGTLCVPQLKNKSVNTANIFQVQQDSLEEARKDVACLKQENALLKEKLLKVTSPVARMESDDDQTRFFTGLPSYAVFVSLLNFFVSAGTNRVNWL